MVRSVGLIISLLFSIGCDDDDCCSPGGWKPDAPPAKDADEGSSGSGNGSGSGDDPTMPPPDAARFCTTLVSYPPPGAGRAVDYAATTDAPHVIYFNTALDQNPLRDYLVISLYAGYGVFTGGDIRTGAFSLSGAETRASTCGACVMIATDAQQSSVTEWYVAQSGTLTLTSVNVASGQFAGTLSNVTFYHFTIDGSGAATDYIADQCTTVIPSATLSGPLVVSM